MGAREVEGASPVAMISFQCWQTRFGADRDVVGQTFRVQGELLTVIGVAPRAFTGLEVGSPADVWVPESLVSGLFKETSGFFSALVGRLRPAVRLQGARPAREADGFEPNPHPMNQLSAGLLASGPSAIHVTSRVHG